MICVFPLTCPHTPDTPHYYIMRTDSRSGLAFSSRGLEYEYRLKKTHHFFVKTKATIHYRGSEPGFTLQWKVCGVNKTYLRSQFICNTAVVAVQEKKEKSIQQPPQHYYLVTKHDSQIQEGGLLPWGLKGKNHKYPSWRLGPHPSFTTECCLVKLPLWTHQ